MENLNIKERIDLLKRELERANRLYYVENAPQITDYEYDLLMRQLQELEARYPQYASPNSPTKHVGSDLAATTASQPAATAAKPASKSRGRKKPAAQPDLFSSAQPDLFSSAQQEKGFRQYHHKYPMLSLGNTYDEGELLAFGQRITKSVETGAIEFSCELKFDGTAICLTYIEGELARALTRGDGTVGDDVTENVRRIASIPQRLKGNYPREFEIRGEIYMPFEAFDALNHEREEQEEPLFANPRNAAAGSLKLQEAYDVASRGLHCVLYHLIAPDSQLATQEEALKAAASWGLPVSEYSKCVSSIEGALDYIHLWDTKRKELPFPTDGIVVKVNSFAMQKQLGFTAKAPRWATAWKFKPEEACTRLLSIDYQVGRTGAITPVANLEPVQLSGTMVKRATLHNADQMILLDIHIGDYVWVEKGGEIIPKITRVALDKRTTEIQPALFPTSCPDCGTPLVRDAEEARHFCPNSDGCPMQIKGKFLHFISRKAMNINAGEATITQLWERGYIKELPDLYRLTEKELLTLEKWKERSAANFLASIEESRSVPFARVLFGLGIRHIGETTAKSLASRFGSMERLRRATKEELLQLPDVGEALADSLTVWFAQERHINMVRELAEAGLQMELAADAASLQRGTALKGLTIMISGVFSISRDEMKEMIEANGGKVGSSVSKNTSYLVAGEKAGGSKLEKAEKLGVKVISEEDFKALLEGKEI